MPLSNDEIARPSKASGLVARRRRAGGDLPARRLEGRARLREPDRRRGRAPRPPPGRVHHRLPQRDHPVDDALGGRDHAARRRPARWVSEAAAEPIRMAQASERRATLRMSATSSGRPCRNECSRPGIARAVAAGSARGRSQGGERHLRVVDRVIEEDRDVRQAIREAVGDGVLGGPALGPPPRRRGEEQAADLAGRRRLREHLQHGRAAERVTDNQHRPIEVARCRRSSSASARSRGSPRRASQARGRGSRRRSSRSSQRARWMLPSG